MNVQMTLPDYVVSPNEDLWEVSDNGEAFVWTDNRQTAALSVQLAVVCGPVLQHRGGLPSLTAVLFLVDAFTAPISLETAGARVETLIRPIRSELADGDKLRIIHWLVACGQLNTDLRKGSAQQGEVLNNLMEDAPQSLFEVQGLQAIDTMQWLRLSLPDRGLNYYCPHAISQVKITLAVQTLLHFASSPLNDASLRLRLQTGLNAIPDGAFDATIPPATVYSRLFRDLRDDDELGQFIQMASNAASTIALPRRPSNPDELQVGGLSDITNRGEPERLLATELAADPDLLLARIAHGQALYMRRESPPQHKALRRRVFIENGVRMWGLTRLRAAAFALAVAACEERSRGPQLDVMTVAGANSWIDDLSTREGLVAQLARLEPDAHPGEALMQLVEEWDSDSEEFAEPLLIVSRNTHLDPDFRSCVKDFPRPYLLARIDKEGLVELLQCTRFGEDVFHKQRMVLPLKKLASRKRPSGDLPIFLGQSPCPLRFSADLSVPWASRSRGPTLWTLTHDRRLMCFDTAGVGAIEVLSLPGEILRACPNDKDIMLVVAAPIGSSQKVRHLLVHASCSGETRVLNIDEEHNSARKVHFEFDGHLLRIGDELAFIDTESGKVLASESLERKRHIGGRFFYFETSVWAAVYDYNGVRWHNVGQPNFYPGFAFFSELDFPIVYSYDFTHFQLLDGQGAKACRTGTSLYCKSVPKLLFWLTDFFVVIEVETPTESNKPSSIIHKARRRRWFKLHRNKISEVTNNYSSVLNGADGGAPRLVTTKSVRNRMQGIAIVEGTIVLFRNPSLGYAIDFADFPQNQRRIVLRQFNSRSPYSIVNFEREFKVDNSLFSQQWTLRKAILPQGAAWLDSRGLLHLRAHDGSELSLVLHDNHVSGWHSDGSVFGSQYFINRPDVEVPASVEGWLTEFANP